MISDEDTKTLISDINGENLDSWQDVHNRYNTLWQEYPKQKLSYALACWSNLENEVAKNISGDIIQTLIEHSVNFNNTLLKWAIDARKKDYDNIYRQLTYSNQAEMNAVLGVLDDDLFVNQMKEDNKEYFQQAQILILKLKKDYK